MHTQQETQHDAKLNTTISAFRDLYSSTVRTYLTRALRGSKAVVPWKDGIAIQEEQVARDNGIRAEATYYKQFRTTAGLELVFEAINEIAARSPGEPRRLAKQVNDKNLNAMLDWLEERGDLKLTSRGFAENFPCQMEFGNQAVEQWMRPLLLLRVAIRDHAFATTLTEEFLKEPSRAFAARKRTVTRDETKLARVESADRQFAEKFLELVPNDLTTDLLAVEAYIEAKSKAMGGISHLGKYTLEHPWGFRFAPSCSGREHTLSFSKRYFKSPNRERLGCLLGAALIEFEGICEQNRIRMREDGSLFRLNVAARDYACRLLLNLAINEALESWQKDRSQTPSGLVLSEYPKLNLTLRPGERLSISWERPAAQSIILTPDSKATKTVDYEALIPAILGTYYTTALELRDGNKSDSQKKCPE
jgi:hypothetical protein